MFILRMKSTQNVSKITTKNIIRKEATSMTCLKNNAKMRYLCVLFNSVNLKGVFPTLSNSKMANVGKQETVNVYFSL